MAKAVSAQHPADASTETSPLWELVWESPKDVPAPSPHRRGVKDSPQSKEALASRNPLTPWLDEPAAMAKWLNNSLDNVPAKNVIQDIPESLPLKDNNTRQSPRQPRMTGQEYGSSDVNESLLKRR